MLKAMPIANENAVILSLACGATVEATARQHQVSERTLYRKLGDAKFRARVAEVRSEMVKRATAMLSAASSDAVRTLVHLQRETMPAAVRLGAARAVLEIGLKLRDMVELEARLQELEDVVAKRHK